MNDTTHYWDLMHELYGDVKRCRGPFLYTQSGKRLTDLYQDDGRAILGWGAGSSLTVMKRLIDRGATGTYRTAQKHRLARALSALFPHIASQQIDVIAFAREADCLECAQLIAGKTVALWRPWLSMAGDAVGDECVAFCPPLPWGGGVFLLAASGDAIARYRKDELASRAVVLSPPVEAAAARAVWDLIAAIGSRCEQQWFLYDTITMRYWRREGPYLYPKVPRDVYPAFAEHCLRLGIVVHPCFEGMSIVPFGANKGVFEVLRKEPFEL